MARKYLRDVICVLIGLLCGVGHGAQLPDLMTRLEKLNGKGTIGAAVHIEDRRPTTEDSDGKPLEKGDFTITVDANSLTVVVEGKVSDSSVFRGFSLLRIEELTQYGPHLARELDGLKLIENGAGSHQGVSCRHWRLKSEEKQNKFGVSATLVKDVDLWVDSDGYPVAGSFKTQKKGRLLLFKFSESSTRSQRYQRLGTRLVLVLDKSETDAKTKAGSEKRTVTTTLTVKKN